MKLAIIGATGFVGQHIVSEALNRDHQVTAIARHTDKLSPRANLKLASGDITDVSWLKQQLQGQDCVISAFNPGWGEKDLYEKFVAGSAKILEAVTLSGIKHFLVVGGAGSLEVAPGVELVDTPAFPAEIKPGALAARALRNTLRTNTQLDWTVISPPAMLEPGEKTGQFRYGTTSLLMDGDAPAKITVSDLAVAILDEIEQPRYIRQQFTVGY